MCVCQYAVMVGLACAGFLACGVWSLVQGQAAPLMGRLEAHLERTARAYEINTAYSHTWDAMQSRVSHSLCVVCHC